MIDNVNHDVLDKRARAESVRLAARMEIKPGDEVTIGESAYRIVQMTETGVTARMIAERGHTTVPGSPVLLDLRLPGWTVLSKAGGYALRRDGDPA